MRCTSILLVLLLSGCSFLSDSDTYSVPVKKGAPVVYIHPLSDAYGNASVGVLPFQVPGNMSIEQRMGVAGLFKDVMLGKRVFKTVKQLNDLYSDLDTAIDAGKRAGVDLVLAGRINYALEGSELGGARVDVSVRLINTGTGNTVWYVEQTMDQPMDYPDVGFFHRVFSSFSRPPIRQPTAAPAVGNMLAQIAFDMADVFDGARTVSR